MITEVLGFIHAISYILAKMGTLHQLFLIWSSKAKNKSGKGINTAQISLRYRGSAIFFFMSMVLWGLSLEPIDWMVTISRSFGFVMFILIVREIWVDRRDSGAKNLFLLSITAIVSSVIIMFFFWDWFKQLNPILGGLTVFFSFGLLLGLSAQIQKTIKAKTPGKQSLVEISFQLIKDLSGVGYGLLVGFNKMWPLVIALFLTAAIRIVNIAVYIYYWRKKPLAKRHLY